MYVAVFKLSDGRLVGWHEPFESEAEAEKFAMDWLRERKCVWNDGKRESEPPFKVIICKSIAAAETHYVLNPEVAPESASA